MMQRVKTFLLEARQEFRHVNWPSRKEAIRLTSVVILISAVLAVLLGGFDYLLSEGLRRFILR